MGIILFSLIASLLGSPAAHAQYLEPEEVLLRDQAAAAIPHNQRQAQAAADKQEQDRIDRLMSSAPQPASSSSVAPVITTDTTVHPSAGDGFQLDPITERLLLRLQNQNTQPQQNTVYLLPDGTVHSSALHSGAPLAGSGPAQTAAICALFIAVGWTLWRAHKLQAGLSETY